MQGCGEFKASELKIDFNSMNKDELQILQNIIDEKIEYYDNVCDSYESKMHEQLINESTKDNK